MSANHTPGPWIVVNEYYGQIIRGAETEREDCGTKYKFRDFVASTWGERSEINDVNARLIAAAPELLDMAECLRAICARVIEQYGPVQCGVDFAAMGGRVNQVIAKATEAE